MTRKESCEGYGGRCVWESTEKEKLKERQNRGVVNPTINSKCMTPSNKMILDIFSDFANSMILWNKQASILSQKRKRLRTLPKRRMRKTAIREIIRKLLKKSEKYEKIWEKYT